MRRTGVCLPDSVLPDFPNLRTLRLCSVDSCNLYGLLRNASKTLQELWLFNVRADPASRHLPATLSAAGEKDWPLRLE